MEAKLKTFFSSPRFAVAGASSDPLKFGNRVFSWYLQHSLPATPLNPKNPSINVGKQSYESVPSPSALSNPSEYSLSVITPPAVTLKVLQEAKEAGIPAVWLQPGSFDANVLEFARKEFKAAIGGTEPGTDGLVSRGEDGWCVLVDGERGLKIAERDWEKVRL